MNLVSVRVITLTVVAAIAAGCSSSGSQFAPAAGGSPYSSAASPIRGSGAALQIPERLKPFIANGAFTTAAFNQLPQQRPSWMRFRDEESTTAPADEIWVSGFGSAMPIGHYRAPNSGNHPPVCQTPGLTAVNSIGTDRQGHLWVPVGNNGPGTGYVQEYNCNGSYGLNISVPDGQPSTVAFDSKGDIIVGDIAEFQPSTSSGEARVYNSKGTFLGLLTDPSFYVPPPPGFISPLLLAGVAVDAQDNCYVSHYDFTGAGEVVEFAGCRPAKSGKILAGPHVWAIGAIEFDPNGNLVVPDIPSQVDYRVDYVKVYAPPYDKAPIRTIPLQGTSVQCPLSSDGKRLYCGDIANYSIDVYSYATGKYLYSFMNGMKSPPGTYGAGVAVAPPRVSE